MNFYSNCLALKACEICKIRPGSRRGHGSEGGRGEQLEGETERGGRRCIKSLLCRNCVTNTVLSCTLAGGGVVGGLGVDNLTLLIRVITKILPALFCDIRS